MISFKKFLEAEALPANVKQAWKETTPTIEAAAKWIMQNNLEQLATGNMIYRGFEHMLPEDIMFIDSTNGKRVSKDSSGMYQAMMDASDKMKSIPSRSNSFICTTNKTVTKQYGHPHIIFPKKGTKLAVSEADDFWHSQLTGEAAECFGITDVERMNAAVARTLRDKFHLQGFRGKSAAEIDELISSLTPDEFISTWGFAKESFGKKVRDQIEAQGGKNYFTALSNLVATPNNLGVEIFTYGKSKIPFDVELWFSGRALVVNEIYMDEIIAKLPPDTKISSSVL